MKYELCGHPTRLGTRLTHSSSECYLCWLIAMPSTDVTDQDRGLYRGTTNNVPLRCGGTPYRYQAHARLDVEAPQMVDLGGYELDFRNNWETPSYNDNVGGPRFDLKTLERRAEAEAYNRHAAGTLLHQYVGVDALSLVRFHLAKRRTGEPLSTATSKEEMGRYADDAMERRYTSMQTLNPWESMHGVANGIPGILIYATRTYCPFTGRPLRSGGGAERKYLNAAPIEAAA